MTAARSRSPAMAFSHLGIHVTDLRRMERFYAGFMGFTVTDRGELDTPRGRLKFVFLSRDPRDHHQLVLASGRPRKLAFNVVNQISFRVASLGALRALHARLRRQPVTEVIPVTHGNAVSVYFRDPEGNRVELFADTPWYVKQPMRVPVDFSMPEKALWRWLEAHARSLPGFEPAHHWRARIAKRMRAA